MSIADRLRSAREEKDLSIEQVAARLSLTVGAVRHHENGTRVPKTETIARYSKIYGVNADWLMRGTGKGPHPSNVADFIDVIEDIAEADRPRALAVLRQFTKR